MPWNEILSRLKLCGETSIDRKGTAVTILIYTNSYEQYKEIEMLNKDLEPLCFRGDLEEENAIINN